VDPAPQQRDAFRRGDFGEKISPWFWITSLTHHTWNHVTSASFLPLRIISKETMEEIETVSTATAVPNIPQESGF
jgi:hypothetical protein